MDTLWPQNVDLAWASKQGAQIPVTQDRQFPHIRQGLHSHLYLKHTERYRLTHKASGKHLENPLGKFRPLLIYKVKEKTQTKQIRVSFPARVPVSFLKFSVPRTVPGTQWGPTKVCWSEKKLNVFNGTLKDFSFPRKITLTPLQLTIIFKCDLLAIFITTLLRYVCRSPLSHPFKVYG